MQTIESTCVSQGKEPHEVLSGAYDEKSRVATRESSDGTGIVWALLAIYVVVTLLAGYVLCAKVAGLTPFSKTREFQLSQ